MHSRSVQALSLIWNKKATLKRPDTINIMEATVAQLGWFSYFTLWLT